jgi:hypothetical protein
MAAPTTRRRQTNGLRNVSATFLGVYEAVHYNGGHPAIAKASGFLPQRSGLFDF